MYKSIDRNVKGKVVRLRDRQILVWSEAKAAEEAKTRDRHFPKTLSRAILQVCSEEYRNPID